LDLRESTNRGRENPALIGDANVSARPPDTPARDDQEEPGPPADTRPLSPAVAIVRLVSGGALHGSVQALIAKSA
jgi:hypothetical protein